MTGTSLPGWAHVLPLLFHTKKTKCSPSRENHPESWSQTLGGQKAISAV